MDVDKPVREKARERHAHVPRAPPTPETSARSASPSPPPPPHAYSQHSGHGKERYAPSTAHARGALARGVSTVLRPAREGRW